MSHAAAAQAQGNSAPELNPLVVFFIFHTGETTEHTGPSASHHLLQQDGMMTLTFNSST